MNIQPPNNSERPTDSINNPFIVDVNSFIADKNLERLVILTESGYISNTCDSPTTWIQNIQLLDFETFERMGITETIPPKNYSQQQWNDMIAYVSGLSFKEPKKHIYHSEIESRVYFVAHRLSRLHSELSRLQIEKSELSTLSDSEQKESKIIIIQNTTLRKIQFLLAKLKSDNIELPFDSNIIGMQN